MKNILKKLKKYANQRNILIGFSLIVIFNLVLFPIGLEKIQAITPNAAGPFDLEFSYTYQQALEMLESYTPEGRRIYTQSTIFVDVPYPIIYGITFTLLLLILLPWAFPGNTRIETLAALPFVIVMADFIENTGIILMLKTYPDEIGGYATFASTFSSIKWSLIVIMMLIIIGSAIKMLINRLKNG